MRKTCKMTTENTLTSTTFEVGIVSNNGFKESISMHTQTSKVTRVDPCFKLDFSMKILQFCHLKLGVIDFKKPTFSIFSNISQNYSVRYHI